jgi:hypothetical protein
MIGTLAWKEHREHQGVWLTMAVMTIVVGWGLPRVVSQGDQFVFTSVSMLTILGMTLAYGVVCGAMMFAGEHEGGTMTFLDIFHGRRERLWAGKMAIGTMFAITEGLAVAAVLWWLGQESPIVNLGPVEQRMNMAVLRGVPYAWFVILPLVGLEAFAWGLYGSSLTRRALPGAAIGAVGVSVCWIFMFCGVPVFVLGVRLVVAIVVLSLSFHTFVTQPREVTFEPTPMEPVPVEFEDALAELLERYDRDDREVELLRRWAERDRIEQSETPDLMIDREVALPREPAPRSAPRSGVRAVEERNEDAKSPGEVLGWLAFQQYGTVVSGLAFGCFVAGLIVSANPQVLWPIMTLLLGVLCGTAAFAPEQRDLSYQFLAAQHFPLSVFWRFKILLSATVAVLGAAIVGFGALAGLLIPNRPQMEGFTGPLHELMGTMLFLGVWLAYGFAVGQIVVWLCRKNILALLLSLLIATGAIGLWMPSMIAGGMNGWQLWLTPVFLLLASWCLLRAWAGGRIQERRPRLALVGFAAAALMWAFAVFAYRVWEIPDVGPPLDQAAFRAGIPDSKDDLALKEITLALNAGVQARQGKAAIASARAHLQAAGGFPTGVLEAPRNTGMPALLHVPVCKQFADVLLRESAWWDASESAECAIEVLTLSRNLRNMAPVESYLVGIEIEKNALAEIDKRLAEKRPDHELLLRVLDALTLHAERTPSAVDCIRTECYRSTGMLDNPQSWNLASLNDPRRRSPNWLCGSVSLSLETPWESERRTRLWRLVWAGLIRGFETPEWQHPQSAGSFPARKSATMPLLSPWLPGDDGVDRERMQALLDSSWLADEKLFCPARTLRSEALRAQVRVDLMRLAVAVAIHRRERKQPPERLEDLEKRFPGGLPVDPYSGRPYGYKPDAKGSRVWSTGPDRVDDGGRIDGSDMPDDDPRWRVAGRDLVKNEPTWP